MNFDFDRALDDLRDTISTFTLAVLLANAHFSKSFHDMELKYDMITKHNTFFLFVNNTCS